MANPKLDLKTALFESPFVAETVISSLPFNSVVNLMATHPKYGKEFADMKTNKLYTIWDTILRHHWKEFLYRDLLSPGLLVDRFKPFIDNDRKTEPLEDWPHFIYFADPTNMVIWSHIAWYINVYHAYSVNGYVQFFGGEEEVPIRIRILPADEFPLLMYRVDTETFEETEEDPGKRAHLLKEFPFLDEKQIQILDLAPDEDEEMVKNYKVELRITPDSKQLFSIYLQKLILAYRQFGGHLSLQFKKMTPKTKRAMKRDLKRRTKPLFKQFGISILPDNLHDETDIRFTFPSP